MELSKRWLTEYLTHRFGRSRGINVSDFTRFTRGSSRQTWFVTFEESNATRPRTIVFRADLPGGSTDPSPLQQEYLLYERLGHTNVPVAKALWWEDDPAWTSGGRPFYVREHVEGSWDVPHFHDPDPSFDELRIETSKEHLRKLALVHSVDWKTLGFDRLLPAPADASDCARNYVDWIQRRFEELRVEPILIALEACEWLRDHALPASQVCLCKGTNGLGEEIFANGKIVAMSDWEEASIGDPAADFAFMQEMTTHIERDGRLLWGLEPALHYYRSISGIEITPAAVGYYGWIRALKMISFGHNAALSVTHYDVATVRQAWTATECIHIGKRILASAMQMLPPLGVNRFKELLDTV
jgi:aminoglycoside phosphotransferase (APT) family kinase protein